MTGEGLDGVFPVERFQAKRAGLAVGFNVDAAQEIRAPQKREAKVAELALWRRDIAIYSPGNKHADPAGPVIKAAELLTWPVESGSVFVDMQ